MPKDDRFPDNHSRYMHRQALDTIVSACFSKWETSEVLRKLEAAKIANENSIRLRACHLIQFYATFRWFGVSKRSTW